MGDSQLKSIGELDNIFDSETIIPNRDALPTSPDLLMKKSSKLPRVEDHMDPTPRVESEKEYKDRDQKLPSKTHATPPSVTKKKRYTKKMKKLVKQLHRGHGTGNKYGLPV